MKRIMVGIFCVLLLAGCGKKAVEQAEPSVTEIPVEVPAAETVSGRYVLSVQQEVYSSLEERLYFYL